MFLPSGDQSSPPASVAIDVSFETPSHGSRRAIEIGNPDLRSAFLGRDKREALAIRRPARTVAILIGNEDASDLDARRLRSTCGTRRASGTIQMCGVFLLAARSTSTALNSTHLPSGEGTGSPTRFSFIMSSKVKGCLVCGEGGKNVKKCKESGCRTRRIRSSAYKRDSVEQP